MISGILNIQYIIMKLRLHACDIYTLFVIYNVLDTWYIVLLFSYKHIFDILKNGILS